MTRNRVTSVFMPLAGLVAVLAIGFGGEALYSDPMWQYEAYVNFEHQYNALHVIAALTTLLSTSVLLLLSWWVFRQAPRLQAMAVVYLSVGLLIDFYQPVRMLADEFLRIYPLWPDWAWRILAPNTLFTNSAGGLAALGLLLLVPRWRGPTG